MYVVKATVTFTSSPVNLGTALSIDRATRIYIEPDPANTHVCYLGDVSLALGTSTVDHVIKRFAQPGAATVVLDSFDMDVKNGLNQLHAGQYVMDGTSGEKAKVTAWVG